MLTLCILKTIFSNAFTSRKDLSVIFNRGLIALLIVSFIIGLGCSKVFILNKGIGLFSGLFHNANLTITFNLFIILVSIIILQLTAFFPRKQSANIIKNNVFNNLVHNLDLSNKTKEQYNIIEYPLVILFIITGAIFLVSCNDTISIFLSIELQSYGLYLLCALYRDSESSTGAGLTYFLLGGLSSCFILLAFAILYANSGVSALDNYYIFTSFSDLRNIMPDLLYWYNNNYINYCLVILSVGLLFKMGAAPFHYWSPDVYDAIPTIVTTFVANIAKISIFILLIVIVNYTGSFYLSSFNWISSLLISSLMSLIIGTILGLNQSRIKRLLAYSTISHLGFMLLAVGVNSVESLQALIFYLIQYSISNINIFILIISVGYTIYMHTKKEKSIKFIDQDNSPIQYTSQLKGYFYINPMIALSLTIIIYSFVGIPPLVGFFGKQMVLSSALDKGYIFIALVAIITSVISAVYYLNVIKEIFFSKSDYAIDNGLFLSENNANLKSVTLNYDNTPRLSSNLGYTISTLTLVILLFMLNPEEWLRMTNILAITIYN